MEISDLMSIGKLKFGIKNRTPYIQLRAKFLHLLPKLSNIFLIFTDHRVRYGKIDIVKMIDKDKATIKIDDDDLLEELLAEESVNVCIDEDEINSLDEDNEYFDPIGMKVIWNEQDVGVIKYFFYNGAHDVYEIELHSDKNAIQEAKSKQKLVLIPDVEAFVKETNIEKGFIKVVDLDQFIYD